MITKTHKINKVFLDIHTNSLNKANDIKENLDVFLKEEVFPYIESSLNSFGLANENEIIQIPKLTIDISNQRITDFEELKRVLLKEVNQVIEHTLTTEKGKIEADVTRISYQENRLQSFIYFLKEGRLPWFESASARLVFEEENLLELFQYKHFKTRIENVLANSLIKRRLIKQFSNHQIQLILHNVFTSNTKHEHLITANTIKVLEQIPFEFQFKFWEITIDFLQNKNIELFAKKWLQLVTSFINKNALTIRVITLLEELFYFPELTINKKLIDSKTIQDLIKNEENHAVININKIRKKDKSNSLLALLLRVEKPDSEQNFDKQKTIEKNDEKEDQNLGVLKNKSQKNLPKGSDSKDQISAKNITDNNSNHQKNNKGIDDTNKVDTSETLFSNENEILEKWEAYFKQFDKIVAEDKKKQITEGEQTLENTKTDYYIKNAGLIILHPYLNHFFNDCGLIGKQEEIIDKELAVHLLHYAATKQEKQFESDLLFEKFICGVPLNQTMSRNINISNELKEKSEELLSAVVENWDALSGSSNDLLRSEFLQRSGKLSLDGDNPKIIVERKTQDILLDRLPWNISIFKMPWMEKLIFADW